MKNLSDVHDHSFGEHYGVLIKGLPIPLLARAIFVVDPSDTIKYVEIVPEIAQEPNYEPALAALRRRPASDPCGARRHVAAPLDFTPRSRSCVGSGSRTRPA